MASKLSQFYTRLEELDESVLALLKELKITTNDRLINLTTNFLNEYQKTYKGEPDAEACMAVFIDNNIISDDTDFRHAYPTIDAWLKDPTNKDYYDDNKDKLLTDPAVAKYHKILHCFDDQKKAVLLNKMAIFFVQRVINTYDGTSINTDDEKEFGNWLENPDNKNIVGPILFDKAKELYEALKPYRNIKNNINHDDIDKPKSKWDIDDPNCEFNPTLFNGADEVVSAPEVMLRFYKFLLSANVSKKMFFVKEKDNDWGDMGRWIEGDKEKQRDLYNKLSEKLLNDKDFKIVDCTKESFGMTTESKGLTEDEGIEIIKINIGGTAFAYPIFVKIKKDDLRGIYVLKTFIKPTSMEGKALLKPYQMAYDEGDVFDRLNKEVGSDKVSLMHMVRGLKLKTECAYDGDKTLDFKNIKRKTRQRIDGSIYMEDKYYGINYEDFMSGHCPFSVKNTLTKSAGTAVANESIKLFKRLSGREDYTDNRLASAESYQKSISDPGERVLYGAHNVATESLSLVDNDGKSYKLRLLDDIALEKAYLREILVGYSYKEATVNTHLKKNGDIIFDQLIGKMPHIRGIVGCLGKVVVVEDGVDTTQFQTLLTHAGSFDLNVNVRFGEFRNEITQDEVEFGAVYNYHNEVQFNGDFAKGNKKLTLTVDIDIMPGYKLCIELKGRTDMKYYTDSVLCTKLNNQTLGNIYDKNIVANRLFPFPNGIIVSTKSYNKAEMMTIINEVLLGISDEENKIKFTSAIGTIINKFNAFTVSSLLRHNKFFNACTENSVMLNAYNDLMVKVNDMTSGRSKLDIDAMDILIKMDILGKEYETFEYDDIYSLVVTHNHKFNVSLTTDPKEHLSVRRVEQLTTSKHQRYISLAQHIRGINVFEYNDEKKHRFCNELQLQKTDFQATFVLMEYLAGGDMCSNLTKMPDRKILSTIIQIFFQIYAYYGKFDMYHGDLHANNVMFGFDENYDPAVPKVYKYTYFDRLRKNKKEIFIPVSPLLVKIIDFDKSYTIKNTVKDGIALVSSVKTGMLYMIKKSIVGRTAEQKWREDAFQPDARGMPMPVLGFTKTVEDYRDDRREIYTLVKGHKQRFYNNFSHAFMTYLNGNKDKNANADDKAYVNGKTWGATANNGAYLCTKDGDPISSFLNISINSLYVKSGNPNRSTPQLFLDVLFGTQDKFIKDRILDIEKYRASGNMVGELSDIDNLINKVYDTSLVEGEIISAAKDKILELTYNGAKHLEYLMYIQKEAIKQQIRMSVDENGVIGSIVGTGFLGSIENYEKKIGFYKGSDLLVKDLANPGEKKVSVLNLAYRLTFAVDNMPVSHIMKNYIFSDEVFNSMNRLTNKINVALSYSPLNVKKFVASPGDYIFFLASIITSLDPTYADQMRSLNISNDDDEEEAKRQLEKAKADLKFHNEHTERVLRKLYKDPKNRAVEDGPQIDELKEYLDQVTSLETISNAIQVEIDALQVEIDAAVAAGDYPTEQSKKNEKAEKVREKEHADKNVDAARDNAIKRQEMIQRNRDFLSGAQAKKEELEKKVRGASVFNVKQTSINDGFLSYLSNIISGLTVEQFCRKSNADCGYNTTGAPPSGVKKNVKRIVKLIEHMLRCTYPLHHTINNPSGRVVDLDKIDIDYKTYYPSYDKILDDPRPTDDTSKIYDEKLLEAKMKAVTNMAGNINGDDNGHKFTAALHENTNTKIGMYGGGEDEDEGDNEGEYEDDSSMYGGAEHNYEWMYGDPFAYLEILDELIKTNKFNSKVQPIPNGAGGVDDNALDEENVQVIDAIDLTKYVDGYDIDPNYK